MYIYNITLSIDKSIHNEWLQWIASHINEVLATGKFSEARLTQVLVDEEDGATTYSIQYRAKTREDLDEYYRLFADKLRAEGLKKFGDKMLAFRTELKMIKEFYPKGAANSEKNQI